MAQPANTPLPPPPMFDARQADPAAVTTAIEDFRRLQLGAATGDWVPFEAMLAEGVTFYAPVAGFEGLQKGKAFAKRLLFAHHAENTRTSWTLMRTVANGSEIGFEVRAEGAIVDQTQGYSNNLLMLLRIEEGQIAGSRDYASTTGDKGHEIDRGAFEYIGK